MSTLETQRAKESGSSKFVIKAFHPQDFNPDVLVPIAPVFPSVPRE